MPDAQILVISTTVDAEKNVHPNISISAQSIKSGKCLNHQMKGFNTNIMIFILFIRNK